MLGRWLNLDGVREQLGRLPMTARLLVGALGVIAIMALLLISVYAGRGQYVPVGVAGPLDSAARVRAVSWLNDRHVPYRESGQQLLVRPQDQTALLADLAQEQLITSDQIDFKSVLAEDNVFLNSETRRARYLLAKMNFVSRMLSEMRGVEHASVIIDEPDRRGGLGRSHVPATASVTVRTTGEVLTRGQAESIASVVANAHASLARTNVTVADVRTGRSFRPRDEGEVASTQYLEIQQAAERHVRSRIEDVLRVIPGAVVAVNAQVDATRVVENRRSYDDPKTSVAQERIQERMGAERGVGGEAGLRPNVGLELAGVAAAAVPVSETREDTTIASRFGGREARVEDPRGFPLRIDATVLVPRSHMVRVHERSLREGRTSDSLAAVIEVQLAELRDRVEPLINTSEHNEQTGSVVVNVYDDDPAPIEEPVAATAGLLAVSPPAGLVSTIGLGALAVVSIVLMLMMVRRAGRPDELPTPEELAGLPPALATEASEIVGEAEETPAVMEGVEVHEEDLRRQQLLDQINDLALSSSADAAHLLRRWIRSHD